MSLDCCLFFDGGFASAADSTDDRDSEPTDDDEAGVSPARLLLEQRTPRTPDGGIIRRGILRPERFDDSLSMSFYCSISMLGVSEIK